MSISTVLPNGPIFGYAFPGELNTAPWVSATSANLQKARALGANTCGIPIWYNTSASSPFTTLTTLVNLVNSLGMMAWVAPHLGEGSGDAQELLYYNGAGTPGNPTALKAWMSSIATALAGTNAVLELGNEWQYTGAQAATYNITYSTYITAYDALLPTLAGYAQSNGLLFACHLPLDQSPEQQTNLEAALEFPYDLIAGLGASFITGHVYPISTSGSVTNNTPLETRLGVLQAISAELGIPLHLSETNAAYSPYSIEYWKIGTWENYYRSQKQNRTYWQWVGGSPSSYDCGSAAWQYGMPVTAPAVGAGQHG